MKKFSSRKISLLLALIVVSGFLIAFLLLYLTRPFFPYPEIRNRDHNPAKLENCMHVVYNKELAVIDNIYFENKNDNIYVEVITDDSNIDYTIHGLCGINIKESGMMLRKDSGHLYYCFNYDYFDIDNITILLSQKHFINEVNVYYLR